MQTRLNQQQREELGLVEQAYDNPHDPQPETEHSQVGTSRFFQPTTLKDAVFGGEVT